MNRVFGTRQTRDWWNTVALVTLSGIVFSMILLSACSSASRSASNKAAAESSNIPATQPTSLADAGEYGENIYDYAKANDWKNADAKLAALKEAIKKVRAEVKNQSGLERRLDANVAALDRAVTAKDRQAAMREANQLTLDVADMSAAYKLSVSVEVTKLDYYGRELEIWSGAKDTNKLKATAHELRRTWDALRPSVETRNAAEAKKFDALVAQVESAKTPADYARLATPVLDEVDNLEKVLTS